MSNRVLSFRAALLLIISSAAIIWPISYWLPLPNYLAVLNTSEYEQFATTLRGIVIVYILFLVMNIVSAVLAFTAAKMIVSEPWLVDIFGNSKEPLADAQSYARWGVYAVTVAGVLLGGWLMQRKANLSGTPDASA